MSKQVRINVRTAVNASMIRRERKNGRDYIVVPSATMPDGIVMNRVRYPAEAIAKSYGSLENTPAPLGHPNIEGAFVSASDPEGLARGWIGAWNRNVRRENGRVFLDKVIDVETASQLNGGKAVIEAIEKGAAIHTSTGLFCTLTAVTNDDTVDWEAGDIVFDHDAILLGEDGAATPEKGVGIFVNSAGATEKVEVINSDLGDEFERDLNWAADSALRAVERMERIPLLEKIKQAIKDAVTGVTRLDTELPGDTEGETYAVNEEQFNDLKAKVETLSNGFNAIGDQIATAIGNALKPVTDALAVNAAAEKAKADADKAALVNKVVAAGLLDEATATAADVAVLNALAEKATPGRAALLNGAFKPTGDKPTYKLPEGE